MELLLGLLGTASVIFETRRDSGKLPSEESTLNPAPLPSVTPASSLSSFYDLCRPEMTSRASLNPELYKDASQTHGLLIVEAKPYCGVQ